METKSPDVQQLLVIKEEVEQQECSSSLNQEVREHNFIKEETEEDTVKVKEEDVNQFSVTPVDVKSEYDEATSSLTQRIKTEADGDNCGGPEPANYLDTPLHPDPESSESDTDDSENWRETSNTQSGSNSVENPKVHVSEKKDDADHKSLICAGCGKKCSSKSGLTQHSCCEGSLTCHVCRKCFETRQPLKIHMRIHTGGKLFSCSQCATFFRNREELEEHVRIQTGEKPFVCFRCGKCLISKKNLKRHLRIHTGEKSFSCSQCGRSFMKKASLTRHMRIHTGEKPFSCSQCGQCFAHKESLKQHITSHTGEKPFSCSQCGNSFKQKGHLVNHMRIHTGEKPFCCTHCGKSFSQSGSLMSHTRIHTGEKPFSCSQCGVGFSQRDRLRKHMRIHIG